MLTSLPIQSIPAVDKAFNTPVATAARTGDSPTFLNILSEIIRNAAETDAVKTQDQINLALGKDLSIEDVQSNINKAEISLELLVTVKNATLDAYNEIIKMQI
jgi:flagellar hook-basal body complex protein FliE